jgi:hypothetical protein
MSTIYITDIGLKGILNGIERLETSNELHRASMVRGILAQEFESKGNLAEARKQFNLAGSNMIKLCRDTRESEPRAIEGRLAVAKTYFRLSYEVGIKLRKGK